MNHVYRVILTASFLAVSVSILTSKDTFSQSIRYFCGMDSGSPATMVRTPYGDVPIIEWSSGRYLFGQSPAQRCDAAAHGLQRAYDRNILSLLRAGRLDGEPVICAVNRVRESCSHENSILRLNSETNPNSALASLLNLRWLSSLSPLRQGNDRLLFSEDGFNYSSIEAVEEAVICAKIFTDEECYSDL